MADQNQQSNADRAPGFGEADRTSGAAETARAAGADETARAPGAAETARASGAVEADRRPTILIYNRDLPNPYPPTVAEPGDRIGRAPNRTDVYCLGSRTAPVVAIPGRTGLGMIENLRAPPTVIMTAQARLRETRRQADRRRERNADRANPIERASYLHALVTLCVGTGGVLCVFFCISLTCVIFLLYLFYCTYLADETSGAEAPDRKSR